MKKDSIAYKVILLGILCGLCGLLLSFVNGVTEPIIAQASLQKELANLELIYPGAEFTEVTDYTDDTGLITGVYKAEGKGMVYKAHVVGYNSAGFTFLIAFNDDGTVGGYKVLEQSETSGIGSRAFDEDYSNQILALTSSDPVPLLSGATKTSTAVQQGIDAAKALFNADKGISYDPNAAAPTPTPETGMALNGDYSEFEASVSEVSNDGTTAVYSGKAKGFGLVQNMGDHYSENEATVTINLSDMTVVSVEVTHFGDTEEVGDAATTEKALSGYVGKTSSDTVDITSGATFTSKSIASIVEAALNAASGNSTEAPAATSATTSAPEATAATQPASVDYSEYEAKVTEESNDGTTAVYSASAKGFGLINDMGSDYSENEVKVTINLSDMSVEKVELVNFGDTAGIGDNATSDDALSAYVGKKAGDTLDTVSGATFTSESINAMVDAALNAASGN